MTRKICITGASSGIGRALSFEMAGRGYSLALASRRISELEEIKKEILDSFPDVEVAVRELDVTDYEKVPQVIKDIDDETGGLDIIFANAGIDRFKKVGEGDFAVDRGIIETNLIGAMATIDAAVSLFKEKGKGHIVATTSVARFRGMRGQASYCASKEGLSVYLDAVRAELYGKPVYITEIIPGYIDTPINNMMKSRPFLISPEKGAKIIANLIEKRAKRSTVPVFPWNIIGRIFRILPDSIMAKI